MEDNRLAAYTAVVPSEQQLIIQDMKFYAFVHYSVNTFTGNEWGSGKESPSVFNPSDNDTDSWCEAISAAGMKGVILTCKHHDGFCLWPTETTEHCIRNSPYRNGKGDIVRELSDSCRKYGLKFGVYLSPWDRNAECYGTDAYNDFYIAQLTELLTNYGEIFTIWLDGACGAAADGKPVQKYDFERIYRTARELQPQIVLSNCAPDVRWIGNESGKTRKSEWNVVPAFQFDTGKIADNSQTTDNMKRFQKNSSDVMLKDIGSREFLSNYDEFMWYPAEADVSIRKGWFYHKEENRHIKSLRKLMKIYYNTVGNNALFLLNIPPSDKGQFCTGDTERLKEIGYWLNKEDSLVIRDCKREEADDGYTIKLSFDRQSVDRIRISEDTTKSQRVEEFEIYAGRKRVYKGTIIGFSKIAVFRPVVTDNLTVKITKCRLEPHIDKIEAVRTGAYRC